MTAVAMRLILWVPILMSVLANPTMAQAECDTDANCMSNQYCFSQYHVCVKYTECSRYNREEAGTPAREPGQCGDCLKGYSTEGRTLELTGAVDSCVKDVNAQNYNPERSNPVIPDWAIILLICALVIIVLIGLLYVILRALWNRKFPCQDRSTADPIEKPANSLLMVENGVRASAPPAPSPTQSRNNNNYYDAEESNPLSTIRDYLGNPMVDISQPVKAQGYYPPDYVRVDPSYNPEEDTQTTVQTTFSPPDIDEETIPSGWSPGPSSGGTVPLQPFAAITNQEVQDNATNTALQRYTCPSPSTSQENQGDRENNSSTGNSGGFNYNNTNGNPRGNSNPVPFVQVNQTVNFINQGSNGR